MNEDTKKDNAQSETTHFGFSTVDREKKASLVAGVFHSVAKHYDIMNDLMSLGIHRLWKRSTVEHSGARPGNKVLDLAGGTGDLAIQFSRIVGSEGLVVLSDINESMLSLGRDRAINEGCSSNIVVAQADAQYLPFPENHFDLVTISFGLRNVTDKSKALASIEKCLKPGGKLLVLEFSKPIDPTFAKLYDQYSFNILPKIGQIVADDEASYRYLAESIRMHPDQETLKELAINAGFDNCEYHNFTGGVVALHIAQKSTTAFQESA